MVDATLVSQLLVAVAGAAVYAIVFFAKNSATDFDSFDWVKFGATLLVGAVIGGANFVFGGVLPTQESLESALVLYAGATAIVENVIKAIIRRISPPAPTPA